MYLNESNYFSPEANWEYLGSSQLKDFIGCVGKRGCEARALAKLKGEWVEEVTEPMLVGSYVDAAFEGTLDLFKARNLRIYKKNKDIKKIFEKAEEIITRIERDPLFSFYMSGKKQVIMQAEMFGAKWKIKMDSYKPSKFINDLKVMKEIKQRFWVKDLGHYVSFVEFWGYDQQAAIYQAVEAINSGGPKLPFYISAADKQKTPDIEVMGFDEENNQDLEPILTEIEFAVPRILRLKAGEVEPDRCEVCDYCKHTKVLSRPIYFRELIER